MVFLRLSCDADAEENTVSVLDHGDVELFRADEETECLHLALRKDNLLDMAVIKVRRAKFNSRLPLHKCPHGGAEFLKGLVKALANIHRCAELVDVVSHDKLLYLRKQ